MKKICSTSNFKLLSPLLCLLLSSCVSTFNRESGELSDAEVNEILEPKPIIHLSGSPDKILPTVLEKIIESQIRYPVVIDEVDDQHIVLSELEKGSVHIALEVRPDNITEQESQLIEEAQIEDLGKLGIESRTGWYVPRYMLEDYPDLDTWRGFDNPGVAEIFATPETYPKGRFLGEVSSAEEIDQALVASQDLPLQVQYSGSEFNSEKELQSKVIDRKPILLLADAPSLMVKRYDLVAVQSPSLPECDRPFDSCEHRQQDLRKFVSSDLVEESPSVHRLVQNFSFTNDDVIAIMLDLEEGLSVDEAADNWIAANESLWRQWIAE